MSNRGLISQMMIDQIAAQFEDETVAEHIRANGTSRSSGALWLPAVYSEGDRTLRAKLLKELGQTVPSGYMSEECGWSLNEYVE